MHGRDVGVLLQEGGDLLGVRGVALDADGECLDPAGREPGVHGAGDGADRELQEADLLGERVVVEDHGAAEHVGVAAQVLAVECTTTSAPSVSGCWRYGDANVLSTTTVAPAAWPRSASARMSLIFMSGLLGVSTQRTFAGPEPSTRSTAARSLMSTVSTTIPQSPSTRVRRR